MDADERDTAGLPRHLVLAVGARVMYLVNDKKEHRMVNGARGNLLKFHYEADKRTVASVEVKFDNMSKPTLVKRVDRMFRPMAGVNVHRQQFPLVLAYAVTIHKSQSLSLSCVFADIGQEIFAPGQSLVALSRCRTLGGLHLLNFSPSKVFASKKACLNQAYMEGIADLKFNIGSTSTGKLNI